MTVLTAREKALADVIFTMEDELIDVERWAAVIVDLGMCENDPSAKGVYAVGAELHRVAMSLKDQWREAQKLSSLQNEKAPPCA